MVAVVSVGMVRVVHCVKDGGVALTKAITRGYPSWVKGLMREPFALALQCAEDVRELSRRSVMGKDWVMAMQGHWFFHSVLPSCTSTWIPGSVLDVVCPWYGFCARSKLAWQRAYYVLQLLLYGWVARPTAHFTWDWNPVCGEENAVFSLYVPLSDAKSSALVSCNDSCTFYTMRWTSTN